MRSITSIFKEQNPQDGTIPAWAKGLAIQYAKEAIEEAAKRAKVTDPYQDGRRSGLRGNSLESYIDYNPPQMDKQSILSLIQELK